jgi:hypothetical protein
MWDGHIPSTPPKPNATLRRRPGTSGRITTFLPP